ncbi:MAG: L-histidine N(alpha)-methyltransferase [Candidatus Meridianibacter frigidus]|nr:MAG: L-histidine N(alpha)-methyltransferase [Candidatus Eremiobacteraeota bacterium]
MSALANRISDRLEILTASQPVHVASFAEDVRHGLQALPRWLSPRYFYDDLGSTLFEAITRLPEYYLTRAETEILREYGWEIVRALDAPFEILELGSGSAVKTRLLIEETLRVQRWLRYCPIDISPEALHESASRLVSAFPNLSITAYAADYFAVLGTGDISLKHPVLALLLGSNIGNYEPVRARELLLALAATLRTGDGLLLGADLKKNPEALELAYNDPTGVTAAFNKNLLGRINREFDGDFDLQQFDHVARYDPGRGVVDSFLGSRRAQRVRIATLDMELDFDAGDRIHTESSYKFSVPDLGALGAASGFALKKTWFDAQHRFCVALFLRT